MEMILIPLLELTILFGINSILTGEILVLNEDFLPVSKLAILIVKDRINQDNQNLE